MGRRGGMGGEYSYFSFMYLTGVSGMESARYLKVPVGNGAGRLVFII